MIPPAEDSLPEPVSQKEYETTPPDPEDTASLSSTPRAESGLPTHLGRYRLEEEIARGGMGKILRVHDQDFQRPLAMKVLLSPPSPSGRGDGGEGNEATDRFLREARLTGQLQHPGIPPVQEMGRLPDGQPYFIMKLVQGSSLKALLNARRVAGDAPATHDLPRFVAIFEQICQTLAYAHSQGVIHRDLKPSNIMVGTFGEVQVMDWGLAKELQGVAGAERSDAPDRGFEDSAPATPQSEVGETQAGAVMGTPAYMAPEQARGEIESLDTRCDVFGLGGILCEILTARPPFAAEHSAESLRLAMGGDLSGARGWLKDCGADPDLVALCERCLSPKTQDRLADAGAVAKAVVDYQAELQRRLKQAEIDKAAAQVQAKEEQKRRQVEQSKAQEERKRRRITVAFAALLVLLVLGGSAATLWYYNDQARQERQELLRQSEAARKQGVTEQAVREALDQAQQARHDLHKLLSTPGGVFGLLNQPARWQAHIQAGQASLDRAKALLANAEDTIDPDMKQNLERLAGLLDEDETDRRLAVRLEKVRSDKATIVDGKFDSRSVMEEYPRVFAKARFALLEGNVQAVAARINASAIKEQLVAALDDWAFTVLSMDRRSQLPERLLAVARSAAPDPLGGDRLRQVSTWTDPPALAAR